MSRAHVHVYAEPVVGWRVECDGRKVGPVWTSKSAAVRCGRAVAEAVQPSELFVHTKSGKIGKGPSSRSTFPRASDPATKG